MAHKFVVETLQITFSALGGSVTEGMVAEWRKHEGDHVAAGKVIVAVTTDKMDREVWTPPAAVTSLAEGILTHSR